MRLIAPRGLVGVRGAATCSSELLPVRWYATSTRTPRAPHCSVGCRIPRSETRALTRPGYAQSVGRTGRTVARLCGAEWTATFRPSSVLGAGRAAGAPSTPAPEACERSSPSMGTRGQAARDTNRTTSSSRPESQSRRLTRKATLQARRFDALRSSSTARSRSQTCRRAGAWSDLDDGQHLLSLYS